MLLIWLLIHCWPAVKNVRNGGLISESLWFYFYLRQAAAAGLHVLDFLPPKNTPILMNVLFLTASKKCGDFEVLVTQRETNLLEWVTQTNPAHPRADWELRTDWLTEQVLQRSHSPPETGFATATHANFSVHGATSLILGIRDGWLRYSVSHRRSQCVVLTTQQKGSVPDYNLNEAKSVAGNHWLRLSPSVVLLRGQVWALDVSNSN